MAGELVTFQYDSAGQLQYVNRYADNSYSELVASADYSRDGDGRIASLTYSQGSNQLQEYQYLYNGASRITSMWSLSDGQTNYTYDAAGQLTGAEQSYTYLCPCQLAGADFSLWFVFGPEPQRRG